MDHYMRWETFRNGVSVGGKAITVFNAADVPDALRKAAEMLEHPAAAHIKDIEPLVEKRITIGRVIEIPST